jgi:hypothetical protein
MTRKPLKTGQWVRMKRGKNKGDLCKVHGIHEGGAKAWIQLVPRLVRAIGVII